MPKPQEIARVTALGQSYDNWTSIEIEREFGTGVSLMKLQVAEMTGAGAQGFSSIKLKPGDPAQGYLAGVLAISGFVTVRQVYYDARSHGVEIIVTSRTQDLVCSTVDANPGQYKNYTWLQIAQAVAGKVGVNVQVQGSPPGADKIFPRVSEHVGETRFNFIERLARMRDLHLRDDETGTLIAARGSSAGSAAQLVEGQNILSARGIMRDDDAVSQVTATGAQPGNDSTWGDAARDVSATAQNPNFTRSRPLSIVAEHPGDKQDMGMRANHEVALNLTTMVDFEITVPGWLMDDGSLWLCHIGEPVTVYSPMLVPDDQITLSIKRVRSFQDDTRGTGTTVGLCLPNALGNQSQISADAGAPGAGAGAATPDAPDGGG